MSRKSLSYSVLLAGLMTVIMSPAAQAYGPEGLFGGRPKPDGTIALGNPVDLRQDRPERAQSVLEHPRPDFDPVPLEFGSFELYTTLELGESYDSNIYATRRNTRDDAVGTIRPIVNLFSNWNRHAVSITAFGDSNYFAFHPDENYNNGVIDVSGRYDIANQVWVNTRGGYQRLAESRTSPNSLGVLAEPTRFGMATGGVQGYYGPGKIKLSGGYDYRRFDYNNTPIIGGGTWDQKVRDRNEHVVGGKVAYEASANFKPYISAAYNRRDYDRADALHDSNGYEGLIGFEADLGGITSVELFAGWMTQHYKDSPYSKKRISSPRLGARVDWNVTGLTSVAFEANRTIEETSLLGYNSFYQTGGSATITHELLRNVLLEGNVGYSHFDFNGDGNRKDNGLSSGVGTRYLVNRNLYGDLIYNYERRFSNDQDSRFGRHIAMLRVGIHL
ncbi:MAG: outer membrane beta-barrel protein [Alphaproteobacteria bacterium]|nr:outer membrane beta-barrel protein [Alphaproteobacteria bacterium]